MNFGSFFVRAILFTAVATTEAAFAQGLGTLTGLVSDPSSAGISAASITATEVDTGYKRATATNSEGRFVLPSLRPARYTVTVEAAGFRRFSQTGITLTADETATVNIRMELGTVTETVTVEATAGQVDVSTPTLRQVVDQARMVELPLNGRNAAELTTLVAGA